MPGGRRIELLKPSRPQGGRRALEFARAWYPGLSLDQLRTWRQEADEELEAVRPAIIQRASAIADFTDTSAFAPEVNEDGEEEKEEEDWQRRCARCWISQPASA